MSRDDGRVRGSARVWAFRRLLASPLVRWWAAAVVLNRLPPAMAALGLLLAGEAATGSLADGALLVAASAVGFAVAAPWRGRGLDRRELRGGLQRDGVLAAGSLVAFAGGVLAGAPLSVLVALSGVVGAVSAGLEGGFRALLPVLVAARDLPRASALEAALGEVTFLVGPGLAGLVAHTAGPVAAVAVMAGCALAAALAAAKLPRRPPPATGEPGTGPRRVLRRGPARGVWRLPAARVVYLLAVTAGACVGLLESAMPARVALLDLPTAAAGGFLTAAYTASLAGGLLAAATAPSDPHRGVGRAPVHAVGLFAWLGLGLAALALAPSPAVLAVASLAAGLALAPLYVVGALVLQTRLPPGRHAEGFAVFVAAQAIGAGLGNATTSQLLDRVPPPLLFGLASGLALAAAAAIALATTFRR